MVEPPPGYADPVLVGRGAMAEVYRVRQLDLDRLVAWKRMRVPAPADRARFAREIALLARLADPHIVRLYDGGVAGDQPYLITELVDGPDLESLLPQGPAPSYLPVVLDVLSGLVYLHGQDVVHRDVKPANVLVPREGPARLADFGLARATDSDPLTAAGAVPGTPMYLAPERLLGAPATPASDLYAVGVMLHRMLTGAYPAGLRCAADAFLNQRVGMDAAPVRLAHPAVPAPLAALVDRLLARLPEGRPESAATARAALEQALARSNPTARPPHRPTARPPVRLSSLAGPVFAACALALTAFVFRSAPVLAPAAPAGPLLDPSAIRFERDAAGVAITFSTARPVRARLRSFSEERASTAHRLLVEPAPLDADLELEIGFEDDRSTFPFRLASPLVALERACAGLDAGRLEALCAEVRSGPADAAVRAATLERELVRSGYRAALPLAIRLRGPLLHGAPAAGAPGRTRRARLLSRLARLRRLDRLAARLKLPFSTGVEALLGEEFALVRDARVTSASIPLAVPAGTWLEQSGMHTREVTDPRWRDAASWPLAAAPARGGTAELAVAVDALAPDACVIATVLPAGLELELWAPLDASGPAVLAHRLDAGFLTGQDRVLLAMGLADGGFAPDRLVALHVADRAEIVRRGLGCTVRRAGLNLPR